LLREIPAPDGEGKERLLPTGEQESR